MSAGKAKTRWARSQRVTTTPASVEVDVNAIPLLPPGPWTLYPSSEWNLTGAVPKHYLAYGDPNRPDTVAFLAKKGRLGRKPPHSPLSAARECVTEQILSEIGRTLPLTIADSKLVRLSGGADPDVRFMSRIFLRRGEDRLTHGIEIAAAYLGSQQKELREVFHLDDKREERKFFNFAMMVEMLRWFGRSPEERTALVDGLTRMVVFDAIVGAQDRHPENWGVIESVVEPTRPRRFAPLYDTARGLFWNFPDTELERMVRDGRAEEVSKYADRARPVFGCSEADAGKDVNHFRLAAYVFSFPDVVVRDAARAVVQRLNVGLVRRLLRRRFGRIITPLRIRFVGDLVAVRHERIVASLEKVQHPLTLTP